MYCLIWIQNRSMLGIVCKVFNLSTMHVVKYNDEKQIVCMAHFETVKLSYRRSHYNFRYFKQVI